ncbi:uncharacterized protein At4g26485-like [Silene latifolia]|uniref:uncharacterized protein At4g26485-like n=1 Tax=Silene latifolia TaxID=37657 RepID=UPI003D76D40A
MGQVFSYIWKCIHRPNIEADTTTTTPQNDQYAHMEAQSYYFTIPDGDMYTAQPDAITEVLPFIAVNLVNDRAEQDEEAEGEEEEEEVVKRMIQVVVQEEVTSQVFDRPISEETVCRIGPYSSIQKILLVGEGDFSFSTSLAVAFESASNMIATSLNSLEFLTKHYRKFRTNKKKLESRGCTVIHGVDATKMIQHPLLGNLRFDCIIYNFPHTGNFGKTDANMRKNQNLVRGFIRNAKEMMKEDGEIHITHKSSCFYRKWDIPKIGCDEGLHLIEEIGFKQRMYPGYRTKLGFGSNKDFCCYPSKTFKFGLHSE